MLQAACFLVLWPIIIAGTAAGTYYIVVYSSDISQQLNTSYGPTICLSAVNIISGQLVYGSTLLENWDPRYKTDVSAGTPGPCCCLTLCGSPAPRQMALVLASQAFHWLLVCSERQSVFHKQ